MKILFIHNALSTFVRIDRDLLMEHHEVEEMFLRKKSDINPIQIWNAVRRNDMVFGWFASWHTFLPFLFAYVQRKYSVLVAGGYDTANVPEANYGNQRKWFSKIITNSTIRLAKKVICNSNFTKRETIKVSGIPNSRITVVYHGIPSPKSIEIPNKKGKLVLNVGNVTQENLLRKGIKPFLETAKLLPEFHFVQVGKWNGSDIEELIPELPSNAELKGFVSDEELTELYTKSIFYIQPSLHEGFGMSVVEAMQYASIPIVSKFGALEEVTKHHGIVLTSTDPESIAMAIKGNYSNLLQKGSECALFARSTYTLEYRKSGVLAVINKALLG